MLVATVVGGLSGAEDLMSWGCGVEGWGVGVGGGSRGGLEAIVLCGAAVLEPASPPGLVHLLVPPSRVLLPGQGWVLPVRPSSPASRGVADGLLSLLLGQ